MKKALTILIILLCTATAKSNEIDKLKTAKDIEQLFNNKSGTYGQFLFITADKINGFFKMDVDGNGLTDLIINYNFCFAVLDMGNGHYERHPFFTGTGYFAIDLLSSKDGPLLVVMAVYDNGKKIKPARKNDTLISKHGGLMEYNGSPEQLKVAEIHLTYGSSMVSGGVDVSFGSDRVMINRIDKSNARIDSASYNRLIKTVNYLSLASLKDKYDIESPDSETLWLEVTYDNGQIKRIEDYGGYGTFGLQNLYRQFYRLIEAQHWR